MKLLISVCIVALCAYEKLAAQTSPPGSLETELVSLTNQWTDAILAKDRSKLDTLLAPDFALHGWDGSWHVERALWLENLFQSINIAEYHHSEIVPHIY